MEEFKSDESTRRSLLDQRQSYERSQQGRNGFAQSVLYSAIENLIDMTYL